VVLIHVFGKFIRLLDEWKKEEKLHYRIVIGMVTTKNIPTAQPIRTIERDGLVNFHDIWYQIFLYCLATTLLMHGLAALVSIRSLRKHTYGRYLPILLILLGFLYPLTGGLVTSAFIAWIYTAANYSMEKHYAFVYGAGQTLCLFITSFIRLYGTL